MFFFALKFLKILLLITQFTASLSSWHTDYARALVGTVFPTEAAEKAEIINSTGWIKTVHHLCDPFATSEDYF